jgi:hypothetical protein
MTEKKKQQDRPGQGREERGERREADPTEERRVRATPREDDTPRTSLPEDERRERDRHDPERGEDARYRDTPMRTRGRDRNP